MNRYGVTINNHSEIIQTASTARTAINKVMQRFVEGEFKPAATIRVRFVGKLVRTWYIVAEVPFDYGVNGTGYSRTKLAEGFTTEDEASIKMQELSTSNPTYKNIRLGWCER